MPAFLNDVHEKIREKLIGGAIGTADYEDNEELIKMVTKMAIETVGLAIDNHGEIYNPAPSPARPSFAGQHQSGVHWSGGRRPRGRR